MSETMKALHHGCCGKANEAENTALFVRSNQSFNPLIFLISRAFPVYLLVIASKSKACDSRWTPFKMMLAFRRVIRPLLVLLIEHVVAEEIQLCLIELRWQL
jgi:hypothetical protein